MKTIACHPACKAWIFLTLALLISCSQDNPDPGPDPGNGGGELSASGGVTADDFETYEGALGMVFDARNIARKGYVPATADLTIIGTEGDYSQVLDLDPVSFLGSMELPVSDLTAAAKAELESGLPVGVTVKDAEGNMIFTQEISKVSFASNPATTSLNVSRLDATAESERLVFNGNRPYVLQNVDEGGNVVSRALRYTESSLGLSDGGISGNSVGSSFDFLVQEMNSNNLGVYLIRHQETGHYLFAFPQPLTGQSNAFLGSVTFVEARDNPLFHYRLVKQAPGAYRLVSVATGESLTRTPGGTFLFGDDNPTYFVRPISDEINWEVSSISTSFVAPILPKPQTSFGANSTLTNCTTAGGLSQTVGTNLTESHSTTVGWSESLTINTTNTVSVGAEVKATFGASFFGTGAEYEATLSASYEYSRSVEQSSSSFGERTSEEEQSIFFERTVTVPPQSAALVYDVAQFYPETRIQLAQKLRIRGTYADTGSPVDATVMATLLKMSRFDGVITDTGSDFLEVSLLGTMTLEKVLETQSNVQEVEPNCD